MAKNLVLITAVLLLSAVSVYVGYNLKEDVVLEKVVKIQGETKYIELPSEIVTETYYYTELKDFETFTEFTDWLALQIAHNDPDFNWGWNCEQYAKWLCQQAADDGYFIAYMSINSDEYKTMFGRNIIGRHAINLAWVGELRYWIDTTNNKELYGGY